MNKMVKMIPALMPKLWGGTRLTGGIAPEVGLPVGESWCLSNRPEGMAQVAAEDGRPLTFGDYLKAIGPQGIGYRSAIMADFPILIKYIDAGDALSIQVHPDDTYARTQGEPYGKTEMWVVLDCDPGASLYYGFKEAVTPQRYRESLADGTILELLNAVAVHPGDVFFINAGTVHAIGQGIMVCEIQQNSDTTYRVYDYDRHDPQGLSRPLHIKDALAVSALSPPAKEPGTAPYPLTAIAGGSRQLLGQCPQFRTTLYRCETTVDIEVTPQSFMAVVGLKGKGHLQLNGQEGLVTPQDLWFIPAQEGTVTLTGPCEVLAVDVPGA